MFLEERSVLGLPEAMSRYAEIEAVWPLYQASFPAHERRSLEGYRLLCFLEASFQSRVIWNSGEPLALFWYWRGKDFVYLEHFAVSSSRRSQGIGTALLSNFLQEHRRLILEVEPAETALQSRRIAFYQRLGFVDCDYLFEHPGYARQPQPHALRLMSYPEPWSREACVHFEAALRARVWPQLLEGRK